jgi:dGTPase
VLGNRTVRLNQESVALEDLDARLKGVFKNAPNHVIFVRAEKDLDFQYIAEVIDIAVERYLDPGLEIDADEVDAALVALTREPWWPQAYDGSLRSLAGLKNLTSQLIGRFVGAAEDMTRDGYGGGRLLRYEAELLVPRWARLESAALKAVAAVFVMGRDGAQQAYAKQRTIVHELAGAVLAGAPGTLGPELAPSFAAAADDAGRLRVVVDAVAALTDASAVTLHRQLVR